MDPNTLFVQSDKLLGFEQCYKNINFKDILTLALRLNKKIIENDSEITEFIEVAEMKKKEGQ